MYKMHLILGENDSNNVAFMCRLRHKIYALEKSPEFSFLLLMGKHTI